MRQGTPEMDPNEIREKRGNDIRCTPCARHTHTHHGLRTAVSTQLSQKAVRNLTWEKSCYSPQLLEERCASERAGGGGGSGSTHTPAHRGQDPKKKRFKEFSTLKIEHSWHRVRRGSVRSCETATSDQGHWSSMIGWLHFFSGSHHPLVLAPQRVKSGFGRSPLLSPVRRSKHKTRKKT